MSKCPPEPPSGPKRHPPPLRRVHHFFPHSKCCPASLTAITSLSRNSTIPPPPRLPPHVFLQMATKRVATKMGGAGAPSEDGVVVSPASTMSAKRTTSASSSSTAAPAASLAPPGFTSDVPPHGTVDLGNISAASQALMGKFFDQMPSLIDFASANSLFRKQGAYNILQTLTSAGSNGNARFGAKKKVGIFGTSLPFRDEAIELASNKFPALREAICSIQRDVSTAMGVTLYAAQPLFSKLGASIYDNFTAICHKYHPDLNNFLSARVTTSHNGSTAAASASRPSILRAGNSMDEARGEDAIETVLSNGKMSLQLPNTGIHGVVGKAAGQMRFCLVWVVDMSERMQPLDPRHYFVPLPSAHVTTLSPFIVDKSTIASIVAACVDAPASSDSGRRSWLSWTKGKQIQELKAVRLFDASMLTDAENERLDEELAYETKRGLFLVPSERRSIPCRPAPSPSRP